jgi:hypothetical protein
MRTAIESLHDRLIRLLNAKGSNVNIRSDMAYAKRLVEEYDAATRQVEQRIDPQDRQEVDAQYRRSKAKLLGFIRGILEAANA